MPDIMLNDPNLKQKLEANYPWTGIYKIYCKNDDMKSNIPIRRLLKEDTEGILYIGASDYLPNRIEGLVDAIKEAQKTSPSKSRLSKHVCGKKFVNKELQRKFPFEKLHITITGSDKNAHIDSHYILETEELAKYESAFGEPPPLNEGRRSDY